MTASEVAGRPPPDRQRPGPKHLARDGFSNSSPALAHHDLRCHEPANNFQICVPERTGIEDLKLAPNGLCASPRKGQLHSVTRSSALHRMPAKVRLITMAA